MKFIGIGRSAHAARISTLLLLISNQLVRVNATVRCDKNLDEYGCALGDILQRCEYCCCRDELGDGHHKEDTCGATGHDGNFLSRSKGCQSCLGQEACFDIDQPDQSPLPKLTQVGDNACVGGFSCRNVFASDISSSACQGLNSCEGAYNSSIGYYSCHGPSCGCSDVRSSSIGQKACHGDCCHVHSSSIGNSACNGFGCRAVDSSIIGDSACNGNCDNLYSSSIGNYACSDGPGTCSDVRSSKIGANSCLALFSCSGLSYSSIGSSSCMNRVSCTDLRHSSVGDNSCNGQGSCMADDPNNNKVGRNLSIGDNACNLPSACLECASGSTVDSNTCNGDNLDELDFRSDPIDYPLGRCKACMNETLSVSLHATYTAFLPKALKSTGFTKSLDGTDSELSSSRCQKLGDAIWDQILESVGSLTIFRTLISETIQDCDGTKHSNLLNAVYDSSSDDCMIELNLLANTRPSFTTKGEQVIDSAYVEELVKNLVPAGEVSMKIFHEVNVKRIEVCNEHNTSSKGATLFSKEVPIFLE